MSNDSVQITEKDKNLLQQLVKTEYVKNLDNLFKDVSITTHLTKYITEAKPTESDTFITTINKAKAEAKAKAATDAEAKKTQTPAVENESKASKPVNQTPTEKEEVKADETAPLSAVNNTRNQNNVYAELQQEMVKGQEEINRVEKRHKDQASQAETLNATFDVLGAVSQPKKPQPKKRSKSGSKSGGSDTDKKSSMLKNIVELFNYDIKIFKEIKTVKESNPDDKKILDALKTTLTTHQKNILNISPKKGSPFPSKLLTLINDKIQKLNEISEQRFHTTGGSISTNNSIRRQIFTDLKYITKYLKYKTKYIVFKSKH